MNIIGGDFSGFDTGQIVEDYIPLTKHKYWGKFMSAMLEILQFAPVWTSTKSISGVFFKSGFWGTSHFGSAFHRNATYHVAENLGATMLADVNLSDDDIIWAIGLTAKDYAKSMLEYGFIIKESASYDSSVNPIIGFLKVDMGPIMKDSVIAYLGNIQSRYYGFAHSEREIEKDPRVVDPNIRDVWMVTGVVEVDAVISKLASFGSHGKPFVYEILRMIKDTDLGQRVILAISAIEPNAEYTLYRQDIEISFPPNWLSELDLTDLLVQLSLIHI